MSRVINFDKGSKRRIREVRWRSTEIVSAVLLSLALIVLGVLLGSWEVSHYSAPPKSPQVSQP
jgi:cytoskeletal protein RodZ